MVKKKERQWTLEDPPAPPPEPAPLLADRGHPLPQRLQGEALRCGYCGRKHPGLKCPD